MQIKFHLGKLELDEPLKALIEEQENRNHLQILPVHLEHVLALTELPDHHRDPFDRLLIAQAIKEKMLLLSKDKVFSNYPVKLFC